MPLDGQSPPCRKTSDLNLHGWPHAQTPAPVTCRLGADNRYQQTFWSLANDAPRWPIAPLSENFRSEFAWVATCANARARHLQIRSRQPLSANILVTCKRCPSMANRPLVGKLPI